jgi:hypothetical protein
VHVEGDAGVVETLQLTGTFPSGLVEAWGFSGDAALVVLRVLRPTQAVELLRLTWSAAGVTGESLSPVDKQNWKYPEIMAKDAVAAVLRRTGSVVHTLCGKPDQAGCNDDRQGMTESWHKAAGPYARIDTPLRLVWDTKASVIYFSMPDRVLSVSIKPNGCIHRLALVPGAYGLGQLADGALLVAGHEGGQAKIYLLSRATRGKAAGTKTEVAVRIGMEGTSMQPLVLEHVTSIVSAGTIDGQERVVLVDAGRHCVHIAVRVHGSKGEFCLFVKDTRHTVGGGGLGGGCALGTPDRGTFTLRCLRPQPALMLPRRASQRASTAPMMRATCCAMRRRALLATSSSCCPTQATTACAP